MVSASVNVLRYSALIGGVVYGAVHQRSIRAADRVRQVEDGKKAERSLYERAKREWVLKTRPPVKSGLIEDPMDPKFDLEAYLTAKAEEAKS